MQYPTKSLYDDEMDWTEFCILLAGIMPETPLGHIISIRSETRADIIKTFTPEQKRIRDEWLKKQSEIMDRMMTEEEKLEKLNELQEVLKKAFG